MHCRSRPYRRNSYLVAYAGPLDGPGAIVMVRNLSRRGAHLKAPAAEDLPAMLDLDIGGRRRRLARIVWRGTGEVGVVFMPEDAEQPGA